VPLPTAATYPPSLSKICSRVPQSSQPFKGPPCLHFSMQVFMASFKTRASSSVSCRVISSRYLLSCPEPRFYGILPVGPLTYGAARMVLWMDRRGEETCAFLAPVVFLVEEHGRLAGGVAGITDDDDLLILRGASSGSPASPFSTLPEGRIASNLSRGISFLPRFTAGHCWGAGLRYSGEFAMYRWKPARASTGLSLPGHGAWPVQL